MASQVNISDYSGSVSAGNWTPAVAAAYAALTNQGGIINIDTDIEMKTTANLSNFANAQQFGFIGNYANSIKANGAGTSPLYLNSIPSAFVKRVPFIGATDANAGANAADTLIQFGGNNPGINLVDECTFAGIKAANTVITFYSVANGAVRNTKFGGCSAGTAMIYGSDCLSMLIDNCQTIDYISLNGLYYDKSTPLSYWVKAVNSASDPDSLPGTLCVQNCAFDERMSWIMSDNMDIVDLHDIQGWLFSAAPTAAMAYIKNARHASLKRMWGRHYQSLTSPAITAIKIENCGVVEIDQVRLENGINKIVIDAATEFVKITNCPGVVIVAEAGANYSVDGVTYKGGVTQIGN